MSSEAPSQPLQRSATGHSGRAEAGAGLSTPARAVFASACGLAVGSAYYSQPLLDTLSDEFSISLAAAGGVITATQIGYGIGLILLVPLGDLVNRRPLILLHSLLSAAALIVVACAPNRYVLLAGMGAIGFFAVATQTLVAYASVLAKPNERGRAVGAVTSGVIIGILLARSVSGTLSDLFGWRSVYAASAAATILVCVLLWRVLPTHDVEKAQLSYPRLVGSVFRLFVEERVLRIRATIGLLIFTVVNMFWTPLVFPLTAPPLMLSHTQVGLFGLAGAMGAVGAMIAGRFADAGRIERISGLALSLMVLSWFPISLLGTSLLVLVVGVLTIDFALQAAHVSNQLLIFRVRPEARSRLTAAYMVCYSAASALGSLGGTFIYAMWGWGAVCGAGASLSLLALIFWWATKPADSSAAASLM